MIYDLRFTIYARGRALAALFTFSFLIFNCGCTSFHVVQTDLSPNERSITTSVKATAFFSGAQTVAKLKALQTDKTQSFGSEGLGQQGPTNTVEALKAVAHILELLRPTP